MYPWMVYVHVLAVFAFLLTHGVSSAIALRMRGNRDPDLARAWMRVYLERPYYFAGLYIPLLILLITGIISAFMGQWWGHGWVWLSLAILIGIIVSMFYFAFGYFTKLRKSLGMPYMENRKVQPPMAPASPEEIDAIMADSPAILLTVIGFGGIAVILWLMMFKPF